MIIIDKLQTIHQESPKGNLRYNRRRLVDANLLKVPSIPVGKQDGMNYTYIGDTLVTKKKEEEQIKVSKQKQKHSISTLKTNNSATKRTNESQEIIKSHATLIQKMFSKMTINDEHQKQPSPLMTPQCKEQESTDEDDQQQQYLKNATPGPGSYQLASTFNTTKNRKRTVSLITKRKSMFHNQSKMDTISQQTVINRKPLQLRPVPFKRIYPFENSSPRFEKERIELSPGPADYRPRVNIEEDLIKNIQKDVRGKFSLEEQRFKTINRQDNAIGPGYYNIDIKSEDVNPNQNSYYFKSKVVRNWMQKNKTRVPGVGTYNVIQENVKQEENDQERFIAPFGISEERFQNIPKKEEPLDSLDYLTIENKTLEDLYKPKLTIISNVPPKYKPLKIENTPGPGYYSPGLIQTKTFNSKHLSLIL